MNRASKQNLAKKSNKETLTKREHKLLVEGYCSKDLLGIYDDLNDLEIADLSDFFELERRNGEGV